MSDASVASSRASSAEHASSGTTLLQHLAQRVLAFEKRQLTKGAVASARACILDAIGVTLAGYPEPCTQILLKTPGVATAPGPALIFGSARRTSALDAALINGTASHALDFDDFSGIMGGHHSVPLVSTLFALAEERGGTGEDLIAAYVIGVEVEIRLARAVNFHHYDKGWHPTATLGIFGTAAAACHLMKLDHAKTTMALCIAASLAGGLKANFGTMTKPLHIGQCCRNGLLAALLAEGGFDAATDVFEHQQGFLNVFNGPGTFDPDKLFQNWGAPWEIEAKSIALKQFPCCGSTHPAIAMALQLRREDKVKAADISRIEVLPHGRRLRHTNNPHPQTSLQAKFSVQYVVARALRYGVLRLKDFEGDAHFDPEITRLLDLTTASPHPDMADDAEDQWGAEVIVTLKDGTRLSRRVDNLVGRGGDNPMSSSELWDKFNDCAARSLPREQIAPLFERLETLEKVTEIAQVTRLLEVSELHKAPAKKVVFAPRGAHEAQETTWVP
ncbi:MULTISPECIES: MmgE/PrpD family protein [unclassified Bradyrhizobium]|uniref:MmgE/PrpD family protein n=1 Tax=unclassified Bradyrhizobium TaxID=2631580 RepID=UPI001BAB1AFD|nr:MULTISPECIES: MmgE/PrpD family protein [unclassified Bradyrhizobium]MBR1229008.1 MmgE/PrpD family protein [Bradyrhizobium sp. AUGA SZCCT0176]MBR1299057.1 MmgE/PrpD family protein [Bradyrhizobium sp. AUGA SZCCT0042]